MPKKNNVGLWLGAAVVGAGIWYLTKPQTANATTTTGPNSPPPVITTPVITVPPVLNPPPVTYPVIKGSEAKVGDKLWLSGGTTPIYSGVSLNTNTGWEFRDGDYVGVVLDISPYGLMKMAKYQDAPAWDGVPHTTFVVSKAANYTKRS